MFSKIERKETSVKSQLSLNNDPHTDKMEKLAQCQLKPYEFVYSHDSALSICSRASQVSVTRRSTIAKIIHAIRSGYAFGMDLKPMVETIKFLKDSDSMDEKLRELPCFSGAIFNNLRHESELLQSNWIILKTPFLGDIDAYKVKASQELNRSLRFCYESPDGCLVMVFGLDLPIREAATEYLVWGELASEIQEKLGLSINYRDYKRDDVFPLSYDPKLVENPSYEPLNVVNTLRMAEPILLMESICSPQVPTDGDEYMGPDLRFENLYFLVDQINSAPHQTHYAYAHHFLLAKEIMVFLTANGSIAFTDLSIVCQALRVRFGEGGWVLFQLFIDSKAYSHTTASLRKIWVLDTGVPVHFESLIKIAIKYGWLRQ